MYRIKFNDRVIPRVTFDNYYEAHKYAKDFAVRKGLVRTQREVILSELNLSITKI